MSRLPTAKTYLHQETRALLTRLDRVKPLRLQETMVPAASLMPSAEEAIERFLAGGQRKLRRQIRSYLKWLETPEGRMSDPKAAQQRFVFLKLRFNTILDQFDIFSDVVTQRSEHETGTWLAGLDSVAVDALRIPGGFFSPPPLACYLDRGHGAAIRRARTRLPGGGKNPVAIIRVPRERMVGSGVASSLVHEVGHQGAVQLDLIQSMRETLKRKQREDGSSRFAWQLWERWISEILADFWSVSRVGVTSTLGLIGVVSLPRFFVFRTVGDDPHPTPWIRVLLSSALGNALYPHPQWEILARRWKTFYPVSGVEPDKARLLKMQEKHIPSFVRLFMKHRPKSLKGRSIFQVFSAPERQPHQLMKQFRRWQVNPSLIDSAPPALVMAVIGQARASRALSPEQESKVLLKMLTHWALTRRKDDLVTDLAESRYSKFKRTRLIA